MRLAEAFLPLAGAPDARAVAFRRVADGEEFVAVLVGRPEAAEAPLVHLHRACLMGGLTGAGACPCGARLEGAVGLMAREGAGVVLHAVRARLAQEQCGPGAGADGDDLARAALRCLGIRRARLLTFAAAEVAGA